MSGVDGDAAWVRIRRLALEILTGRLSARRVRRAAVDLAAQVAGLDDHLTQGGAPPACWLPPDERPLPWE